VAHKIKAFRILEIGSSKVDAITQKIINFKFLFFFLLCHPEHISFIKINVLAFPGHITEIKTPNHCFFTQLCSK
jgi:hypothetical protein